MPFKKTNQKDSQQSITPKRLFVGRADQVRFFAHDILEPEDPSRNIISIAGQGGVGKSTLIQRFLDEAHTPNFREFCHTALVNERQTTPASVMERFADQFREQGHPLKKFEEALTRYKEALRRMQATSAGFHDEQELFIREVVDTAGTLMDDLPFGGGVIHKGTTILSDLVLEKGRTRQFLKDAARLEDPLGDLTHAFVKDLNQLADTPIAPNGSWSKRARRVVLFFDTFEQLAPDIAPWLLDHFLDIDVSTNIILVIAGRESIEASLPDDPKRWLPFLDNGTIHLISLKAFTEEETRIYLEQRGITDRERINQISQLSRGLPLYLGILTSNAEGRIDPNAEVVENFLRWIPKHEVLKRQLALNASLFSLPFTKDDLTAFAYTEQECSDLYTWLIGQPFVQTNTQDGRHTYHDLARDLFCRHLYQRSPQEYYTARKALAQYYQKRLTALQAESNKTIYTSNSWQAVVIAFIQQTFCLPDEKSQLLGIEYVLRMYEHSTRDQDDELRRVLMSLLSYKSDQHLTENVQDTLKHLLQYIEKNANDHRQCFLAVDSLLDQVLHASSFSSEVIAYIYQYKGHIFRKRGDHQNALVDYNQALTFNPGYINAYSGRGETYHLMKRYEDALADFDRAITIDGRYTRAIVCRGQVYQDMKRYEDALVDFNRAIALNSKYTWALTCRGRAYRAMKRYEDALADFNRAIALDGTYTWALTCRGQVHQDMKRYEDALADFNRAIALDGTYTWALTCRGWIYHAMKRYEDALADFDRAIALDGTYTWALTCRGWIYHAMKRYEDALTDFDRAITIDGTYTWAIACRGQVYQDMKRYEDALADFNRAITLDGSICTGLSLCRGTSLTKT